MHSSTIATLIKNIESNLHFAPEEKAAEVDAPVEETATETATTKKKTTKKTTTKAKAGSTVKVDEVCDTFLQ